MTLQEFGIAIAIPTVVGLIAYGGRRWVQHCVNHSKAHADQVELMREMHQDIKGLKDDNELRRDADKVLFKGIRASLLWDISNGANGPIREAWEDMDKFSIDNMN